MATTIPEPLKVDLRSPERATSGNGGWRNLVPSHGPKTRDQFSPPPATTAVWVGIAAITMSFMAFTSALVVRKGGAPDWRHLTLPPILYLNTLMLLVSSFTLETARKRMALFMGGVKGKKPAILLYATLALGLLFVAGQYIAWLQLRTQGLYV